MGLRLRPSHPGTLVFGNSEMAFGPFFANRKGESEPMITIRDFGMNRRGAVSEIILENAAGMRVHLLSYGATVRRILVPDASGKLTDVALGYETAAEYEENDGYLGAAIGRNGNRIRGAAYRWDGRTVRLTANEGANQLHGGFQGLDKKLWNFRCTADAVEFHITLADGEEGFPGEMEVTVTYRLGEDNGLRIDYNAWSTADTVANFTNHTYFNLNGQGSGPVWNHVLQLQASRFTPGDAETLPTGEIAPVDGTCMDFREPKALGRDKDAPMLAVTRGYDTNLCLDGTGLRQVARAVGDRSGIVMEVATTLEGVQLYTGNFLTERKGKDGAVYQPYGGFCLETQHYPNAVNEPAFPSSILPAGARCHETTIYRFTTEKGACKA